MTIDELKVIVDEKAKYRSSYSIDEGLRDDALIIERVHGRFVVFYYERGSRYSERWFEDEDEAVEYYFRRFQRIEKLA